VRLNPLTVRDAAALFVERATDGGARLALERNWPIIDDICTRVDRLPLAVELAAKHADHLPLSRLLHLLADRFRLLVDESPRAVSRQRTLEAALRWSYELLDGDEKHLLRHLGVLTRQPQP
jgi:predicted ATPase